MLGLDEAAASFGGSMIRDSKAFRSGYGRNIYAVRIAVNHWLFEARPALNMLCQDKGMPSRATRGEWKIGADGCRGTS